MSEPLLVLSGKPAERFVWNHLPRVLRQTRAVSDDEVVLRGAIAECGPRVVIVSMEAPRDGGARLLATVNAAALDPEFGRRRLEVSLVFVSDGADALWQWSSFAKRSGWSVFGLQRHWRGVARDNFECIGSLTELATALLVSEDGEWNDDQLPSFRQVRSRPGVYAAGIESRELKTEDAAELLDEAIDWHFRPAFSELVKRSLERHTAVFNRFEALQRGGEDAFVGILQDAASRAGSIERMQAELEDLERNPGRMTDLLRQARFELQGGGSPREPHREAKAIAEELIATHGFLPLRTFDRRLRPAGRGRELDQAYEQAKENLQKSLRALRRAAFAESVADLAPVVRTHEAIDAAVLGSGPRSQRVSYHFHWPRGYSDDPRDEVWSVPDRGLLTIFSWLV